MSRHKKKKNVGNSKNIRVLSLCTGYGGLELGLAKALDTTLDVLAVEVETCAQAVICKNAAKETQVVTKVLWPDIKTFPAKKFRGCFDFVLSGYPCQGESVAGKRQGKADPRWLWPHIERIIKTVEPIWFFGENVSGHLSLGFPTVYRSLRNLGYKVEAGLFTAEEVGAPHKRERLFILANNEASGFKGSNLSIRQSQRQKQTSVNIMWISELADIAFLAKREQNNKTRPNTRQNTRQDTCGRSKQMWPSRPGQPQYEWEEPRVVDNTQHRRHKPKKRQIQTGRDGVEYTNEGQTQSRLGRAVNGTSSRVDRLRLLGNGVVPQQAELAFRELIKLF